MVLTSEPGIEADLAYCEFMTPQKRLRMFDPSGKNVLMRAQSHALPKCFAEVKRAHGGCFSQLRYREVLMQMCFYKFENAA